MRETFNIHNVTSALEDMRASYERLRACVGVCTPMWEHAANSGQMYYAPDRDEQELAGTVSEVMDACRAVLDELLLPHEWDAQ